MKMTNLNLLWIDKTTKLNVVKSIYSYSKKDTLNTTYFIEWLYKNKIKIRLKMSKNQRNKFIKHNKIPTIPKEHKSLSSFGVIKYSKKSINTKQNDKQGFIFKIGQFSYKINIIKGVNKFKSTDKRILNDLFTSSILF